MENIRPVLWAAKKCRDHDPVDAGGGLPDFQSALMKKTGEYFDRFASHEAHVQVVAGDNTVLVLTLKPINAGVDSLGYTELTKIGIPSDIARNLN